MIKQLRLDERLIHGQVATSWTKYLGVNAIVVASDEVVNDQLAIKILKMGAPQGVKVAIKTVADAIKLLQDPRSATKEVLMLVTNPADAYTVSEALDIKDINVANFVKDKGDNAVRLEVTVFANPENYEHFKKLVGTGRHVFTQVLPTDAQTSLKNL